MRHDPLLPGDLFDGRARIGRNLLVRREPVLAAPDHRFGQIQRIVGNRDPRQVVATADPVLGQRGLVARRHAVAPVVVLFQMRRRDLQRFALEHRRGEASPGVRRHLGRMRPAVHVIRVVDRPKPLRVVGGNLPRDRIHFLPDPHLRRTARDVHRAVRPALPFRQRVERRVPRLRAERARLAHRDAEEFADIGIAGVVFVLDRRPLAGEVHLREDRSADDERPQQTERAHKNRGLACHDTVSR